MDKITETVFDEQLAISLFYKSDKEEDKIKALYMAEPYFSKNQTASEIIMHGTANRYVKDESAKVAKEIFFECIQHYIYEIIHSYYNTFVSTGDKDKNLEVTQSMVNAAMVVLLQEIGKYDSSKGAPVTFCKTYIINGIKKYLSEGRDVKPHFNQQINRVINAENRLIKAGQKVTLESLREVIGPSMSLEQISNALEMKEATERKQSIESEEAKGVSSGFNSPEEEFLRKERDKTMFDAIDCLPEEPKKVLALALGIDTVNRIATGETKKNIEISQILNMKQETVRSLKARAIRQVQLTLINSGYSGGKARAINEHEESVLSEGAVTFRGEEEDAAVGAYLDSIIEIKIT